MNCFLTHTVGRVRILVKLLVSSVTRTLLQNSLMKSVIFRRMSSDKLDIKELQSSLKQLIIGFGHQLHGSSSAEEVQQAYLHMEELDENFHK